MCQTPLRGFWVRLRQRNEEERALSSTTAPSHGQVPARLLRAAGTGQKDPGHCGEPTGTQVKGADGGLEPVRRGTQWAVGVGQMPEVR